jgi:acylphosphatase
MTNSFVSRGRSRRNPRRAEGGVEVEVEGDAEAVLRFERTIRRGSAASRVTDVKVDESPPSGRFQDFRILP